MKERQRERERLSIRRLIAVLAARFEATVIPFIDAKTNCTGHNASPRRGREGLGWREERRRSGERRSIAVTTGNYGTKRGYRRVHATRPRGRGIVTGCSRKFLPTRNSLNNYARPAFTPATMRLVQHLVVSFLLPSTLTLTPSSRESRRSRGYRFERGFLSGQRVQVHRERFVRYWKREEVHRRR